MRYAARLARLEKLAGKGACPSCRLYLRRPWPDPSRPRPKAKDPAHVVAARCDLCGTPREHDLSVYPEGWRDMWRHYAAATPEEMFTDHRAWAAQRWAFANAIARLAGRKVLREMRRLSAIAQARDQRRPRAEARDKAVNDREGELYKELCRELLTCRTRQHEQFARQHGDDPFPDLKARVDGVRGPDFGQLYEGEPYEHDVPFSPMRELRREAEAWTKCAELETIVLGDVTAATAAKLDDCKRRADEVAAAARAKHEAREEKRRRGEAERARQCPERAAAPGAHQPTTPPPSPRLPLLASPMIDNGTIAHYQKLARIRATGERPRDPRE